MKSGLGGEAGLWGNRGRWCRRIVRVRQCSDREAPRRSGRPRTKGVHPGSEGGRIPSRGAGLPRPAAEEPHGGDAGARKGTREEGDRGRRAPWASEPRWGVGVEGAQGAAGARGRQWDGEK